MATYSNDEIIVRPHGQSRFGMGGVVMLVLILGLVGLLVYWFVFKTDSSDMPAQPTATDHIITPTPQRQSADRFDDGLRNPDTSRRFQLDEFGEGLSQSDIFNVDINADGRPDKITRNRYENGTDHFYYDYTLQLNTPNGYVNVTPEKFRTIEGSECALRKIQFVFVPEFYIKVISRPWQDSWTTPTLATLTTYSFDTSGSHLNAGPQRNMERICDVSELF